MGLNISIMDYRLKSARDKKSENDHQLGTYTESMIYQQDIVGTNPSFEKISGSISDLKNMVSNIIAKTSGSDTTIVNNDVDSALRSFSGSIDVNKASGIQSKIKVASEEVYNEYYQNYKNVYYNYDRAVESALQGISRAKNLESKMKDIEDLEEKEKIESRIKSIISDCDRSIKVIENANSSASEILEKGLKKVSGGSSNVSGLFGGRNYAVRETK